MKLKEDLIAGYRHYVYTTIKNETPKDYFFPAFWSDEYCEYISDSDCDWIEDVEIPNSNIIFGVDHVERIPFFMNLMKSEKEYEFLVEFYIAMNNDRTCAEFFACDVQVKAYLEALGQLYITDSQAGRLSSLRSDWAQLSRVLRIMRVKGDKA